MSFVFLFIAIVGALLTLNAYRPFFRHGRVAIASFLFGWLVSELPLHHVVWQLAFAALFVHAGALHVWPGQLAFAVTLLSCGGLGYLLVGANESADLARVALEKGLGAGYAARIGAALRSPSAQHLTWRRVVQPFVRAHADVERLANIPYEPTHGRRGLLDIYRPRDGALTKRPVLLQIHGGAWILSSKDDQGIPLMIHLASHGWICVAINYRLSPRATWPDHIVDVKRAIAWVKAHIAEYGGDPEFVVLTGGSAGGHLASLAALTPSDRAWQPGFEDADTRVQGCVSFYGIYHVTNRAGIGNPALVDLLERIVIKRPLDGARDVFDRASPLSHVTDGAPPFMVIHGTHDTLVPVAEARLFVEALRARSREPVVYVELPGAQHAFEVFVSVRAANVIRAVERFVSHAYAVREKPIRSGGP
jgi:acetyl esterase/lipase